MSLPFSGHFTGYQSLFALHLRHWYSLTRKYIKLPPIFTITGQVPNSCWLALILHPCGSPSPSIVAGTTMSIITSSILLIPGTTIVERAPPSVRMAETLPIFRWRLKTHLFRVYLDPTWTDLSFYWHNQCPLRTVRIEPSFYWQILSSCLKKQNSHSMNAT